MGKSERVSSIQRIDIPIHPFLEETFNGGLPFHITEDLAETAVGELSVCPHRHPFYEIVYIKSGKGKHIIDTDTYDELDNTVFFIAPGQMHCWKEVISLSGVLIYFSERFLFEASNSVNSVWELQLFRSISSNPGIRLNKEAVETMDQLIQLLIGEYSMKQYEYASVLRAHLNAFLIHIYRNIKAVDDNSRYISTLSLSTAFKKLVESRIDESNSVSYYAHQLGVSAGYLTDQVKKQTGVTAGKIIRQAIVLEAKRLIINTDLTVSKIAEHLGFQDTAYFCRLFKRETNVTPSHFRANCKQQQASYSKGKSENWGQE